MKLPVDRPGSRHRLTERLIGSSPNNLVLVMVLPFDPLRTHRPGMRIFPVPREGHTKSWRRQQGAALVVSLIFLFVMTIIGIMGMQVTSLEEKMAGNMRERNLAFQAAESAARAGEKYLSSAGLPAFNCAVGLYKADDVNCDGTKETARVWEAVNWSTTAVVSYADGAKLANVSAFPAYIVEELPAVPETGGSLEAGVPKDVNYYRVTARGIGGSPGAVAIVQSVYKR